MSWNGFPKYTANRILKKYKSLFGSDNKQSKPPLDPNTTVIFLSLPYVGKQGEALVRKCCNEIKYLVHKPLKFQIHWQTTKVSFFTSTKDPVPKDLKSSVVYQFDCSGCGDMYIGKTNRNLITRVKEHCKPNSEIYNHTSNC